MSSPKTITEHFRELKNIAIPLAILWVIFFCIIWNVRENILQLFLDMSLRAGVEVKQVLSPTESFSVLFKLVSIATNISMVPFFILAIWKYLGAELTTQEKKFALISIFIGSILLISGVLYGSLFVIPAVMEFFASLTPSYIEINYNLSEYIDFSLFMLMTLVGVFQLPLLIIASVLTNLISIVSLKKNRKGIYFGLIIAAALITPTPDLFTLAMVALPLLILFEFSIIISSIFQSKKITA